MLARAKAIIGRSHAQTDSYTILLNDTFIILVSFPPETSAIDCGQLNSPTNGNVTFSDTGLGAQAVYTCDVGFILVGSDLRTCMAVTATGMWSGDEPECDGKYLTHSCVNFISPYI